MTIVMNRKVLIAELEKVFVRAQALDERRKKAHIRQEKTSLAKFKQMLKAAQRWTYGQLKRHYFRVYLNNQPSCPTRESTAIAKVLRAAKLDDRDTLRISSGSDYHNALMWGKRSSATVCD